MITPFVRRRRKTVCSKSAAREKDFSFVKEVFQTFFFFTFLGRSRWVYSSILLPQSMEPASANKKYIRLRIVYATRELCTTHWPSDTASVCKHMQKREARDLGESTGRHISADDGDNASEARRGELEKRYRWKFQRKYRIPDLELES